MGSVVWTLLIYRASRITTISLPTAAGTPRTY